ncbi:MAG: peptidoglycan DD-metalloendopeptidase family protein [Betaproteobacteria bacterium]
MNKSSRLLLLLAVLVLAACSSRPPARAPVEDRSAGRAPASTAAPAASTAPSAPTAAPARTTPSAPVASNASLAELGKPLRGLENAGKPGHYTVQRGDTLVRIALDHGQNWRDLARWNQLDNPNLIEVGEVMRVIPPGEAVVARPMVPGTAQPQVLPPLGRSVPPASTAAVPPPAASASVPPASPAASADDLVWAWPAQGQTVAGFDEAKNKGLDIAGTAGEPVLAAADGRVVYADSGLRGYGKLIIVKHNNTYLTAYAHNQTLLVKEDQPVRQGQKIAEMGSTDTDRVKLHFEIRRQGKPVDPLKFLPPR